MKKLLLSFALIAMALGANAQVGVKTVTTSNGTKTEFSHEVVQSNNSRAFTTTAEVVWNKSEEYGIGGDVSISKDTGNGVVNWETNDSRMEAYSMTGTSVWDIPTTTEWPFTAANKSGSLYALIENTTLYTIGANGNTIGSITPGGSIKAAVVNNEGTAVYIGYENETTGNIARYTKDGSLEWSMEMPSGIVGVNISDDESKLIMTCASNNTLYVLDPEAGDILQDNIYYYQNSPKQAPGMSYDGEYIAWGDFNGKGYLYRWNGEQYEEVWSANITMSGESSCWGYGCAVSSDGSTIVLGTLGFLANGYDGYVFVFNNYSGTPLWSAQTNGPVNTVDVSSDGSLIAAASDGPMDHSTGDLLIYRRQSSDVFLEVNTAGSMIKVDLSDDGALCIGAGKGVHSYEMGWGGNAYLIRSTPSTVGSLSGVITLNEVSDFSGATVTIEGIDNYYEYTNTDGEFMIKYIPEGTYNVTIEKTGFTTQTISNVTITASETATIEATLDAVGSPIQNLYATKGVENFVELRWEECQESLQGYNIYRKDNINSNFDEPIATVDSDKNTYNDETAIPTKTYYYAVTAIIDENVETPFSNIEEGYASTGFLTDVIEVYNGSVPTIDGILTADEWADAFKADISDFTGISEGIDPIGTVYLYLKTDGNKLYMAIVDYADTELSENDCLALYFDDNNDHVYPQDGDNSEGNYWFKYSGGTGIMQYRPIYANGSVGDVAQINDAEVAFSDAAGHVTGEFVLEFGNEDHQIKLGDEDASSVYLFYRSSGSEYHAYWPYNNVDTFNPVAYDTFKFFTNDEAPAAATNLRVDEDILGTRNYVPVRWDMPEINDFQHFLVHVNSPEVAYTVYGPEVIIDVESNTDYSVFVTTVDNYGHVSDPSETLTFHVGNINVEEIAEEIISLYPNPASSVVYIESEMTGAAAATIIDMAGRLVKSINISDMQNASISVEDLHQGLYFFMIQQDNTIIVRKITVK